LQLELIEKNAIALCPPTNFTLKRGVVFFKMECFPALSIKLFLKILGYRSQIAAVMQGDQLLSGDIA
jgi:hypothetical protein